MLPYTSNARARHGKVFGAPSLLHTPTSPASPVSPTNNDDDFESRKTPYNTPYQGVRRLWKRYSALVLVLGTLLLVWHAFGGDRHAHKRALYALDRQRRLSSIQRHRVWPGWQGISKIYAFGDSYSSTGFDPLGAQPCTFNPIGNPFWPGRTANHGPNYLGHLTGSFNESVTKTYSLAVPNAVIIQRDQVTPTAPTLEQQIEELFFHRYGRSQRRNRHNAKSGWSQQEALFVLAAGTDDLVSEFVDRQSDRNMTEVALLLAEYHKNLDRLYEYGARNFLIVGFPMVENSPRVRMAESNNNPFTLGGELVDLNGRLAFLAQSFAETHTDTAVFFFDAYDMGVHIRNGPSDFPETAGFKEMDGFCVEYAKMDDMLDTNNRLCGGPLDTFYWRDEQHQTEPYQRLMARLIVEQLKDDNNMLPFEFY